MTSALMHSSQVETFQFSAGGQRTVQVSVMSSGFPAADCSTLTDQRLKSFIINTECAKKIPNFEVPQLSYFSVKNEIKLLQESVFTQKIKAC